MEKNTLQQLHSKIDQLVDALQRARQENQILRENEQSLLRQRSRLLEKNDLAKSKVESMIMQLRSIEKERCH